MNDIGRNDFPDISGVGITVGHGIGTIDILRITLFVNENPNPPAMHALNEKPNPPAMLGRLEENVLGMRK